MKGLVHSRCGEGSGCGLVDQYSIGPGLQIIYFIVSQGRHHDSADGLQKVARSESEER